MSYPIEPQYYDAPLPRITIPRLDAVPTPGAPLSKRLLNQMAEIPFLVNYLDGTRSIDEARFRLAYDDEALFVAGEFGPPRHGRDDLVEDPLQHEQLQILLNPTPEKLRWYRIRMRPHEVMTMDAGGEEAPDAWWSDAGQLVQQTDGDGWSFAARVPFALLGAGCPKAGALWRLNFFRMFTKRQEDNASWSLMSIGRPDVAERYGEIAFGDKAAACWLSSVRTGPNGGRAVFEVANAGSAPESLSLGCRYGRRQAGSARARVPAGVRRTAALDFGVPDGGSLLIEVRDDSKQLMARIPVETGLPPLRVRIGRLRGSLRGLRSGAPVVARAAEEMDERLSGIASHLSDPRKTAASWQTTERALAKLEYAASLLPHRNGLTDPNDAAAALVETTLTKVFPERALPSRLKHRIELVAPRRGSDAVQIVVIAFDRSLSGCTANASPLSGPRGAVLPDDALELALVDTVPTRRPRYTVDYVGPHPDPLLPVEPFSVEKGGHRTLWVTVAVPPEAEAGVYRCRIIVTPDDGPVLFVPLRLRVWDFDLPSRPTLRTVFPMFEQEFERYYGSPMTRQQRLACYDFLLRRRISPSCQYEDMPLPRIEDLEYVVERGSNVVSTGYLHAEQIGEWLEAVKPVVEFLRSKGWMHLAYVYGFDEIVPGSGYPVLKGAYRVVAETFPDLARSVTIGPSHNLPELFGTVDIWIPQTDRFEPVYKERQAAGDDLWWYISMWPRHPFANMFVDYPATEHRILFWQTWKYGVTGFLYYCINIWSSNTVGQPSMEREPASLPDPAHREAVEKGARWPEVPWNTFTGPTAVNGDGQLAYPGPDGTLLSSVRLECVRHGIEDYELLARLREETDRLAGSADPEIGELLDDARRLLAVPPEVCEDMTHYTHDPLVILRARREVGELIERMVES